jgi:tripartite-type tricarboxylate transporter receptor subunit TctC
MVHVPYSGGAPALVDLLSGQVQVRFGVLTESIEYIKGARSLNAAWTSANNIMMTK